MQNRGHRYVCNMNGRHSAKRKISVESKRLMIQRFKLICFDYRLLEFIGYLLTVGENMFKINHMPDNRL